MFDGHRWMVFCAMCLAMQRGLAADAHAVWMEAIERGFQSWSEGQTEQARLCFESALRAAATLSASDPHVLPATHSHLADLHSVTGRLNRAEFHASTGLALLKGRGVPPLLPLEAKLRMALGLVRYQTNRTALAEADFDFAAGVLRRSPEADKAELALALLNIAVIRIDQHRPADASGLFDEIEALHRTMDGRETVALALALEGRGRLHLVAGRHADAEAQFRKAIEMVTRISGSWSPELAPILRAHALSLEKLKRKTDAKRAAQQAAAIAERAGPNWRGSSVSVHSLRNR